MVKVRLLLLPFIGRFRLLPLNHAAAHDAVKTPQIEERDGPKQSHGNDLCRNFKIKKKKRVEFKLLSGGAPPPPPM